MQPDDRRRAPAEEEAEALRLGFTWNEETQSYWSPMEVDGFEEYGGSFENFLAGRKVRPARSERSGKSGGRKEMPLTHRQRKRGRK